MKTILNNLWAHLWTNFLSSLFIPEVSYSLQQKAAAQLLRTLEGAKQEWKDADNYFNEVTDPDLIEYATYLIETTRRKYVYLIKKAKEMEVTYY